ncbi:MAG: alpha-L-fucosidase [Prevotellaceae bacterium]|jgi:alpha-L-fucosidase|nr:alpha-L-fucosidase [Prevotellaceae bacterium]
MKKSFFILTLGILFISCNNEILPPEAYGILPSERQLKWHELEYYGFIHFTINTFTDKEWGYGDEVPDLFNPSDFDADKLVSILKESGMKAVILTCKHHDGFCLWPSNTTEHTIRKSPWHNGKGDLVREMADACKKHDLKFGVYLSPWDRNNAAYGTPAYIDIYRNQLRELLSNYGEIFEVWFDGANGGDGYYGGARETRKIDRTTYYDWPNTWQTVRELQPGAVIFSDIGPDLRWVGNEKGYALDPCWATYTPQSLDSSGLVAPGYVQDKLGQNGTRNGEYWMPAECDVSIRPGWFWHESQNGKVKTPEQLFDLYIRNVGLGGNFLLNVPPNRHGHIHETDEASLRAFGRILQNMYTKNLAEGAKISAPSRGKAYKPENLLDNDPATYWATVDKSTQAELIMELPQTTEFNVVSIREYILLGQRIDKFTVEVDINGEWQLYGKGESIGARRLIYGETVSTARIRIKLEAPVCIALSEFGLYEASI